MIFGLRIRHWLAVGLVGAALLWVIPAARAASDAPGAWRAMWAAEDANARAAVLLETIGHDADKLRRLIRGDRSYASFRAGWQKRQEFSVTETKTGKTWPVTFHLRVPRGYDPNHSGPVVLACHGQGSNGRKIGAMVRALLGDDIERVVVVAADMPGPRHYNARPYQEQAYLRALDWVRRNLNIDDDYIYVTGYSQGGHGTWHLATMFPHRFSAAVPMAGVPVFEGSPAVVHLYMPNLHSLALWHLWGENDTAAKKGALGNVDISRYAHKRLTELDFPKYRGTEIEGASHGEVLPDPRAYRTFLKKHTRVEAPNDVVHHFHRPNHRRQYYLQAVRLAGEALDFTKTIRIPIDAPRGKKPGPWEIINQQRDWLKKRMFRLNGSLDRKNNRLTIRATGVNSVRVDVLEGMFDLSQPITVVFGRAVFRGMVPVSARCMLKHYRRARDGRRLVLNRIELSRNGRSKLLYEPEK